MFEEYKDLLDLVRDIREHAFDCSDFTTVAVFTAWGFCTLYPEEEPENEAQISYRRLLQVLKLCIPPDARKVPHTLTVEKDQQKIYGGKEEPVQIFINQFPDKTEMILFEGYTTR